MAAKEKLKAGAVIIETPSAVFLNTLEHDFFLVLFR